MTDRSLTHVCPLVLMRHKDNFLPSEDGKGSAGRPPQEPGDGDRKRIFPGEPLGALSICAHHVLVQQDLTARQQGPPRGSLRRTELCCLA